MSTLGDLKTAAVDALGDGDYTTARTKCEQALAYLAMTPDTSKDGGSLGWSRDAIEKLLAHIKRQETAATVAGSTGIRVANMKYKRPGTS